MSAESAAAASTQAPPSTQPAEESTQSTIATSTSQGTAETAPGAKQPLQETVPSTQEAAESIEGVVLPTEAAPAVAPAPIPAQTEEVPSAEDAPDPDEDDLSDLDDVLDEFAAANISKPTPASSGPGRPAQGVSTSAAAGTPATSSIPGAGPGGLFADEDEFAKAMQAGMAELLGEFESNPDMQKQFEDLVKELGEGMKAVPGETSILPEVPETQAPEQSSGAAPASATKAEPSSSSPASKPANPTSFEETIRATMERMSASNTAANTAAANASTQSAEEDFLAAMLKEMEKGGPEGLGMGSDEDFSKMLMGMMEQLTNKEILYEPMKELHDKFPAWMKENEGKCKKEDWDRYVEQKQLVDEIVGKFEEKGYADDKVEYREYIVERMQKMQNAGSPPPDLVGDMNAAQEALGDFDGGCPQQ